MPDLTHERIALLDWYKEDERRISDLIDHSEALSDQLRDIRAIVNSLGRPYERQVAV